MTAKFQTLFKGWGGGGGGRGICFFIVLVENSKYFVTDCLRATIFYNLCRVGHVMYLLYVVGKYNGTFCIEHVGTLISYGYGVGSLHHINYFPIIAFVYVSGFLKDMLIKLPSTDGCLWFSLDIINTNRSLIVISWKLAEFLRHSKYKGIRSTPYKWHPVIK